MAKILLVEDDVNTLAGLYEILSDEGYDVVVAENGETALEKFDAEIDLLLSDFRLPDMSGLELYAKIRQVNPEIKCIIMSAYGTSENYLKARKLGVWAWRIKPLDFDRLLSCLREALTAVSKAMSV